MGIYIVGGFGITFVVLLLASVPSLARIVAQPPRRWYHVRMAWAAPVAIVGVVGAGVCAMLLPLLASLSSR